MNSAPPKIHSAKTRYLVAMLVLAGAAGAVVVYCFNPSTCGFYPVCQFHRLTGLNCPGCGMTRALHALLHGNFSAAWRDNALLLGGAGVLAVRGVWYGWQKVPARAGAKFFPKIFLWLLLAIVLTFTVLRNLPAGAFLSP